MKWDEIGEIRCSVARTLSVLGDRWTLLVVRDAFLGVRRFEDFQRDLGLTRHLLADRLRKLVEHGIFERVAYQEKPTRCEYRLTEKGIDLYPILLSIVRWGDNWMADATGPPMLYVHRGCGEVTMPTLHCPDCGEPVGARDIIARPTPGAPSVVDGTSDGAVDRTAGRADDREADR
jgi:DNA-binding HxlR family transcriptional regulator